MPKEPSQNCSSDIHFFGGANAGEVGIFLLDLKIVDLRESEALKKKTLYFHKPTKKKIVTLLYSFTLPTPSTLKKNLVGR